MSTESLKLEIPKLPQLDKEDVKAIRSFLPGKLLGRTAAFLSLVLGVLSVVIAIKVSLHQFPDLERAIPAWAYGVLFGLCLVAVVAQVVQESITERTRRSMQMLAVKTGAEQTGYFRIGPYRSTPEDRAKFKRADHAETKALEWIETSSQILLYLCGDSGSGKSSLLNAFVLPKMREQGCTVVEARAWQDPERALRDALLKLSGPRRQNAESQGLRETVEDAAKQARDRLLIVLDQFEEFVILGKPEQQQKFAAFVAELKSRPVKGLSLLLVMRSEYQVPLEEIGLPLLRSGENLFQVGRFIFSAASAFIKGSGLDLQADAIDRLLTSAAELDETPGMVRPITLNVIGYVLASGKSIAPSLDAGVLIRRYIERTVEQPGIRDCGPQLLEQMITEQGTKRPRSEEQLVADTKLRRAEVRAVLNALDEAGLARTLDEERAEWELSHDFVAHAVGRFLSRRRSQMLRHAGAYAAPALLAIGLLGSMWMSESYLKEQWSWYVSQRPFLAVNFWPYVLTVKVERALKPGGSFKECGAAQGSDYCPEMVVVPAGSFMMGSAPTKTDRQDNEGPQHLVTILSPFAVSKYELTFDEWDTCVARGGCAWRPPDASWGRGQQPVIYVSWNDAQQYVAWLSKITGKPYRLLSESEYEYATRAGAQTRYPWGDTMPWTDGVPSVATTAAYYMRANCLNCGPPYSIWAGKQTAPVGKFPPNEFGLYDLVGNVSEWVEDCYNPSYKYVPATDFVRETWIAPADGSPWLRGYPRTLELSKSAHPGCNYRVLRGGDWATSAAKVRAAARAWADQDYRDITIGFRVARTLIAP
ncbi:MAG TPA: SUMF1/EgtB/PvdO family nonheme iron enzyme [Gemmataceae bacterium]|nr:SUMF1/EgtB/PvdO family nonheme iron enzyme [Gemmataceae bacterium]